jgi:hypothetical protein
MANLWMDSLGKYGGQRLRMTNGSSAAAWAQVDNSAGTGSDSFQGFRLFSTNPRTGEWHLRLVPYASGGLARRVFGGAKTEVFLGYALSMPTLPVQEPIPGAFAGNRGVVLASFRDAANTVQCSIWLGTDGAVVAYRSGIGSGDTFSGTLLGRSLPVIGTGAYNHIEIYAAASNTLGAIEVRVNEQTVLNVTSVDTVTSANVEFSQVAIGSVSTPLVSSNGSAWIDFADFYANDTAADGSGCDTFVGDVKVGLIMPNANTAQADFSLSTGSSSYELIDETPPNDADYLFTSSATARTDVGLQNLPANTTEILAARPFMRAIKDDAGTVEIAPNLVSDGVKGTVTAQPITTETAYYDSLVALDPDTGAPWTPSALNAAALVVERTA